MQWINITLLSWFETMYNVRFWTLLDGGSVRRCCLFLIFWTDQTVLPEKWPVVIPTILPQYWYKAFWWKIFSDIWFCRYFPALIRLSPCWSASIMLNHCSCFLEANQMEAFNVKQQEIHCLCQSDLYCFAFDWRVHYSTLNHTFKQQWRC